MKIKFNQLGAVIERVTTDEALRQGNVGVNHIEAVFEGIENANYDAYITYERADGSIVDAITMTPDGVDNTKYSRVLEDAWFFNVAGTTKATVKLVTGAGTIAVSGTIQFDIEESPTDETTDITPEQYEELLTAIALKLDKVKGIMTVASVSGLDLSTYANGQLLLALDTQKKWKVKTVSGNKTLEAFYFSDYLKLTGGTMTGDLNISNNKLIVGSGWIKHNSTHEGIEINSRGGGGTIVLSAPHIIPADDEMYNLGANSYRYKDLYLSGALKNGSRQMSLQTIVTTNIDETITSHKTFTILPSTTAGRTYNNDRQLTDKEYVDYTVGQVQNDLDTFKARKDNPHEVTKAQVGLGNVTNDAQVKRTEMGVSSGVATLDENGKVPQIQLPDTVLGQLKFGGTIYVESLEDKAIYDSKEDEIILHCSTILTNTFGLVRSYGEYIKDYNEFINIIKEKENADALVGFYFIIATRKSNDVYYNITNKTFRLWSSKENYSREITQITTGDWLVINSFSETLSAYGWEARFNKIDNTDAVSSVNGKTGAVVLNKNDVGLGNVDNTSDMDKPVSTAQQEALDEKVDSVEATQKFQSKIVSLDVIIQPEDWEEVTEEGVTKYRFITANVFGTLGFVNTDDSFIFSGLTKIDNAYINTFKAEPEDVYSTDGTTTNVLFESPILPTEAIGYRIGLIKKNAIFGDMQGYLNVNDLDGTTIEFSNGKVRVIGGGQIPTASQVMAQNGQSVQDNLERIDERIDNYAEENMEGSASVSVDWNESHTKTIIKLDQDYIDAIVPTEVPADEIGVSGKVISFQLPDLKANKHIHLMFEVETGGVHFGGDVVVHPKDADICLSAGIVLANGSYERYHATNNEGLVAITFEQTELASTDDIKLHYTTIIEQEPVVEGE